MNLLPIVFGAALAISGIVLARAAMVKPLVDPAAILAELDGAESQLDGFSKRLTLPFARRVLGPAASGLSRAIKGILPGNYLDRLQHKLVVAGMSERIGPEEIVTIQALGLGAGLLGAVLFGALRGWTAGGVVQLAVICGATAALMPNLVLSHKRQERQQAIRRDMPDVLDLLAISVEAGVGLEGAVQIVGRHFDSALALELNRMLREMELGTPRRTALQHLKYRCDLPEVSNFVLALIQADALGMPMGRVLHVQAGEMRAKRRQWAREKAAKLPVKILFPMFVFIFPALFVVVLGPAVMSIAENIFGS